MAISSYYAGLRRTVGRQLLMIPAVAAVISDRSGKILIQERPDGGYSLPAGAIEPGEHPAQAIAREVHEETGLTIRPTRLLGVFGGSDGYRITYPNGDSVEYLICLFRCDTIGGTLRCLDGESLSLAYYEPACVPPLHTEYPRALFVDRGAGAQFDWDDRWLCGRSSAV